MHVFVIPFWVMITMAIVLWGTVAWKYKLKAKYQPRIDDYFAQRRHNRRMRNYVKRDIALTKALYAGKTLYDVNTIRKPKVYNAPARHRR